MDYSRIATGGKARESSDKWLAYITKGVMNGRASEVNAGTRIVRSNSLLSTDGCASERPILDALYTKGGFQKWLGRSKYSGGFGPRSMYTGWDGMCAAPT